MKYGVRKTSRHVENDWVLFYKIEDKILFLTLVDTATHADFRPRRAGGPRAKHDLARNLTNANFELDASTEMYRSTEKVS